MTDAERIEGAEALFVIEYVEAEILAPQFDKADATKCNAHQLTKDNRIGRDEALNVLELKDEDRQASYENKMYC